MTFNNTNSFKKDGKLFHIPKVLYENRYCNQEDFSILICGETTKINGVKYYSNDVYELNGSNFEVSELPSMLDARYNCKTAVIGSDILVVGGYYTEDNTQRSLYSVDVFKTNRKSWVYKTELFDKREKFCICSFKQNLYIVGGMKSPHNRKLGIETFKSCFVYNIKYDKWSHIVDMNEKGKMQLVQFMKVK